MLLERFYDEDLAQASYLIACQASGEAIVIDPRRDIDEYLTFASSKGLRIVAVAETHIHADYLSGTRELSKATSATMFVSDEGGPDWTYGSGYCDAVRMRDGHEISLGNITLTATHTPGHTPEHMSLLVTDGAQADAPGFMLTGDFVFVGDVGRPDLLDEVAGGSDSRFAGAQAMYSSVKNRLLTLPDYVQILPAHGAGSACGKALGAIPFSTVGYERTFAWWAPYLAADDEEGFVRELLSDQPDAHSYFARMKSENRSGPRVHGELPRLVEYTANRLNDELESGQAVLFDTRTPAEVHRGAVRHSLNIPGVERAAQFAAWVYDPAAETTPIIALAADEAEAAKLRDHLLRVGIDTMNGYVTTLDGLELTEIELIEPRELEGAERSLLLDVRTRNEHAAGHISGAMQLSGGRILHERDRLPTTGRIISYCQSGLRSSVTASALRRAGFDVAELHGSYEAWLRS